MEIYKGEIKTLNDLPYIIKSNNESWVKGSDIIDCLCRGNTVFFMQYFIGKTYLSLKEDNDNFPLLNTLIAVHQVFENIVEKTTKSEVEVYYEKVVYPFIVQLAKIGAKETDDNRPPLFIMEEMMLSNGQKRN